MEDPKARIQELCQKGSEVPFDKRVPIKRYFRSATEVFRMARIYNQEGDEEKAFMLFNRFAILSLKLIPTHPERQRALMPPELGRTKVEEAISEAEKLKKSLLERYQGEYECYLKKKAELEESFQPTQEADEPTSLEIGPTIGETEAILDASGKPDLSTALDVDYPLLTRLQAGAKPELTQPSNTASNSYVQPPIDRSTKPAYNNSSSLEDFGALRPVLVPANVMRDFEKLAAGNTSQGIETLGVLCGKLEKGQFCITAVLVPEQIGAPDSCSTESYEEIWDFQDQNDLLTIGWIHTHPTQTAFLSSVDMHNHFAYQVTLPEAIAIVLAPKDKPNDVGIFTLTPHGVEEMKMCQKSGFHPHESAEPLFDICGHTQVRHDIYGQIVDLR